YGLYAYFNGAGISDFELASAEEKRARDTLQAKVDELKKKRTDYEVALKRSLAAWEADLSDDQRAQLPEPAKAALATVSTGRSEKQFQELIAVRAKQDPLHLQMCREIDEQSGLVPKLPSTLAMRAEPRETRLFIRGNPERPGEVVTPGVPAFLHPLTS